MTRRVRVVVAGLGALVAISAGLLWITGVPTGTRAGAPLRVATETSTKPPSSTATSSSAGASSSTKNTTPTPHKAATGPPYSVESLTITLTDPLRPTPARGDIPGFEGRTLRTVIRKPFGVANPMPMVVFAHGFDSEPEDYEPLLDAWAAAGYLVASPEFPGSAANLSGDPNEGDIGQQALDLSFVISSLLTGVEGPVDPNRIAVAGHSDGGSTVAVLAMNPDFTDTRISAYIVLAGGIPDGVAGSWDAQPHGALLAAVGDADEYGTYPQTTDMYDQAALSPKALLVVPGGDHLDPFVGSDDTANAMRAATVRFLNLALGHRLSDDQQLAAALQPPDQSGDWSVITG